MKSIVVYRAEDGTLFGSPGEAIDHEALLSQIEIAMKSLGPRPQLADGCWKQHDGFACRLARRMIVRIYATRNPEYEQRWKLIESTEDIDPRTHVIGRILDGGPLAQAWQRLSCIDWETYREYDQPYYASNPGEARTEAAAT